jgi:hypothetical protein
MLTRDYVNNFEKKLYPIIIMVMGHMKIIKNLPFSYKKKHLTSPKRGRASS